MSAPVTLVGRLAGDPELRFLPNGKAVANFTVVTDRRKKNGDTWESVDTTYWRCSCWEQQAENVAESLTKGTLVVVTGHVSERSYDTAEGQKRSVMEVRVEHVGPSLKTATAKVHKAERNEPVQHDPWALSGPTSEPPF